MNQKFTEKEIQTDLKYIQKDAKIVHMRSKVKLPFLPIRLARPEGVITHSLCRSTCGGQVPEPSRRERKSL